MIRHNLKKSILALITLPLLIQILLLAAFVGLERDAELQLSEVRLSRKIIETLGELQRTIYSIFLINMSVKLDLSSYIESYGLTARSCEQLEELTSKLRSLGRKDPEIMQMAQESDAFRTHTLSLWQKLAATNSIDEQAIDRRKALIDAISTSLFSIVNSLLPRIPSKMAKLSGDENEIQSELRNKSARVIMVYLQYAGHASRD
jgi:hypothetical protein